MVLSRLCAFCVKLPQRTHAIAKRRTGVRSPARSLYQRPRVAAPAPRCTRQRPSKSLRECRRSKANHSSRPQPRIIPSARCTNTYQPPIAESSRQVQPPTAAEQSVDSTSTQMPRNNPVWERGSDFARRAQSPCRSCRQSSPRDQSQRRGRGEAFLWKLIRGLFVNLAVGVSVSRVHGARV